MIVLKAFHLQNRLTATFIKGATARLTKMFCGIILRNITCRFQKFTKDGFKIRWQTNSQSELPLPISTEIFTIRLSSVCSMCIRSCPLALFV